MIVRIPLSAPDITEDEIEAVSSVLRTSSLSLGPRLEEFEALLAERHGAESAIAVSSGTAALHLATRALNIGNQDEVIVPSFTFIAVSNALLYEGAVPVFVDIDPVTLNMNPAQVEAAITSRTRAILVVHTFGIPADMDVLCEIAERHHLYVIEDACEAIGATFHGRSVGTFGDIGVFGFYPNKQITTGEGGALLVRDGRVAKRVRAMRNQGRYPTEDWFQHREIGFNYRLSELSCALGTAQLKRLGSILAARAKVAAQYRQRLLELSAIQCPVAEYEDRTISWFVYVVRIAEHAPDGLRDRVMARLFEQGIASGRYFAPIHCQPAYEAFTQKHRSHLPITESVAQRTLALPFFNRMTSAQVENVSEAIISIMREEMR